MKTSTQFIQPLLKVPVNVGVNLNEVVNVVNVNAWVFGFRVDVRWRYDRRGCCRRDDDGAAADDSTRG